MAISVKVQRWIRPSKDLVFVKLVEKRRDRIKTEYCKNKNILLLRLNYKHSISEIENIITNTIYA